MIRTLPPRPVFRAAFGAGAIVLAAAAGCGGPAGEESPDTASGPDTPRAETVAAARVVPIVFTDVTADAGIRFTHNTGAFGEKYLPETLGAGALWLDADGDGRQDLLLVNSTDWPGQGEGTPPALYRNDGNWSFTDVTRGSGLDTPIYGIGGAAADYDNDGHADLYLAALGPNRLYRGRGDGTFADVTGEAGVGDPGFSTSALWFDYDGDGHLDLFVANYVEWTAETDLFCTLDGETKSYCTPESYPGQSATLYRNRGDGTFEDVTAAAGVEAPSAKGLGVVMLDSDADGWMDLFVANDTQPNQLFRNRGDGTFEDIAVTAAVAFSETGVARAGMGADAADYADSGLPGLVIGNFSNEMLALYHNEGNGLFIDEAPRSPLGRATLLTLTFGCFFFDADLDGRLDIFAANGHVADDVGRVQSQVSHAQRPQLFRNLGGGRFEEASAAGGGLETPLVGRGAAYADADGDGDLDVVITANGGAPRLLRNDTAAGGSLRVRLVGTAANRDGIGARVEATAGGPTRWRRVRTGSSYASQSELPVTFGLGAAPRVDAVRVVWPGGRVDEVGPVEANRRITIEEGAGIVETSPIER
ncbi:MAG: CRTAC1 family protein [Acidobacteria bacterium]|nr:CRTAC1 family protein [Acidobacteriota bacterium]